jgi:hypothetical protein
MDTREFCLVYCEAGELRLRHFLPRNVPHVVNEQGLSEADGLELKRFVTQGMVGHSLVLSPTGRRVVIWRES